MSKGLAVPINIGPNGRTVSEEGDAQADKIIWIALSDNDNDNAFQQGIGLGSKLVFDMARPTFRADVMARVFRIFAEFERLKLFTLDKASLQWRREQEGEHILEFDYINLESDEVKTFSRTFKGAKA